MDKERFVIWDYTRYNNVLSAEMMELILEKVSAWYCVSKARWDDAVLVCERLAGDANTPGRSSLYAYCEGAANILWHVQKMHDTKKLEEEKKRTEARERRQRSEEARRELQKQWPN
jgi:hypothetical protein